ncbi:MAG TPA: hypothetical protein DD670_08615, partial [Planctomycetaceae bacterium]|nr:hypothetical protein [Planctomycetaceae bacterium]
MESNDDATTATPREMPNRNRFPEENSLVLLHQIGTLNNHHGARTSYGDSRVGRRAGNEALAGRRGGVAIRAVLVLLLAFGLLGLPATATDPEPAVPKIEDGNTVPKDVPQLLEIEGKFRTVAEKAIKCVVGIQIGPSRGSGVLVSEDGLILTAGHVAQKPGQKAVFTTHDGKVYNGVSLGVFSSADAGMMKITDDGKWPFVNPAAKDSINVGNWCVAIGHPLGYIPGRPPVVRMGRILRLEDRAVQTDCPLISGDSGGPLFNLDGELIGINSRIGGPMDRNYHVPIDVYLENWEDLKKSVAWADKMPQRDTEQVKAAFREVVAKAAKCVVRIRCDKKDVALGTIVGPDGWILTKASELKGRVVVRLADGRELEARTIGVVGQFDLAMLKIDAVDLPNIEWGLTDPKVGQWVAVPGLDKDPLAIGVVSTPRRAIPAARGLLGV